MLKQLSVFIENREGRICELAEVLSKYQINIITLSLADNADYGMVRMIVDDVEKAAKVLKELEYSAMVVEVIAVRLNRKAGSFYEFVKLLVANGVSVEYIYTLTCQAEPAMVLKVSDPELSANILKDSGYILLETKDLANEMK